MGPWVCTKGLVKPERQRLNQPEHGKPCVTSSGAIFSYATDNLLEFHRQNTPPPLGKQRQGSKTKISTTVPTPSPCHVQVIGPHHFLFQQSCYYLAMAYNICWRPNRFSFLEINTALWSFQCLRNSFQWRLYSSPAAYLLREVGLSEGEGRGRTHSHRSAQGSDQLLAEARLQN